MVVEGASVCDDAKRLYHPHLLLIIEQLSTATSIVQEDFQGKECILKAVSFGFECRSHIVRVKQCNGFQHALKLLL